MRASVGPIGARTVDSNEIGQRRSVGGVGAEADKVEVGRRDARDREDRRAGEGFCPCEAGEGRGRERRKRGRGLFFLFVSEFGKAIVVLVGGVILVVVVL